MAERPFSRKGYNGHYGLTINNHEQAGAELCQAQIQLGRIGQLNCYTKLNIISSPLQHVFQLVHFTFSKFTESGVWFGREGGLIVV